VLKDLGSLHYFLCIEVHKVLAGIVLSQENMHLIFCSALVWEVASRSPLLCQQVRSYMFMKGCHLNRLILVIIEVMPVQYNI
jgi:hypothetical protein